MLQQVIKRRSAWVGPGSLFLCSTCAPGRVAWGRPPTQKGVAGLILARPISKHTVWHGVAQQCVPAARPIACLTACGGPCASDCALAGGGLRGGLRFVHTDRKGFVYMSMDAERVHSEFIKIDSHCAPTVRRGPRRVPVPRWRCTPVGRARAPRGQQHHDLNGCIPMPHTQG